MQLNRVSAFSRTFGRILRWSRLIVALTAFAALAEPAAAQRAVGTFPNSHWDQAEDRPSDDDVLPFVASGSETLPEPHVDEGTDNPLNTPDQPASEPTVEPAAEGELGGKPERMPTAPTPASAEPQPNPFATREFEIAAASDPLPPTPAAPSSPETGSQSAAPLAQQSNLNFAPEPDAQPEPEPEPASPAAEAAAITIDSPASPAAEQQDEGPVVTAEAESPPEARSQVISAEAVSQAQSPAESPAAAASTAPPASNEEEVGERSRATEPKEATESTPTSGHGNANPAATRGVVQWLREHGLRLVAILIGMLVLHVAAKIVSERIIGALSRGGARGSREEREARAKTLVGVFSNAASMAIIVGGVLMACEEVGIAVGPLLGGAAVLGLAAAFGAQSLIKDYFYGFMILLENQYRLNDIVKIGGVSGQVERITMRITVLRDIEGNVHFVPNGAIETVTNMSHGWARALFVVGIAYKEDADRVMRLLMELAAELRDDPDFGEMILDDAEMLGLDSFGDSAVNIKFVIKTLPLKQWAVRRELQRRIKRRFDELGIEIPYPHRTLFHQNLEAISPPGKEAVPPTRFDRVA